MSFDEMDVSVERIRQNVHSAKRQKLISLAEQNAIMREYTTLNDEFGQRLKDENRYQDKREVGDKRPIFDSPKKSESSESESEEEAEEIKPYVIESEKEESSTKAKKKTTQKKKKKRNYRK
uniref:Uncharacterized protein n=3 Tax=Rhizophagus irregularis TaxID=588596 RepID=U9TRH0_RHIID